MGNNKNDLKTAFEIEIVLKESWFHIFVVWNILNT